MVKLDLGAGNGKTTPEGFQAYDLHAAKGVKAMDLRQRWPWKAGSVDEVRCAFVLQYLTPKDRIHFFNELYRVLKPGATAQIVTPHWCASKAYMDVQVVFPPVVEGFFHTLMAEWRSQQGHKDTLGLKCNFDVGMGYGLHPALITRNQAYQQNAVEWWKEAAQDLAVTLTKR
jgi:predicted SAM-dependent methyltransferase